MRIWRENIIGSGRAYAKAMRPEQAQHNCTKERRSIWLEQAGQRGEWDQVEHEEEAGANSCRDLYFILFVVKDNNNSEFK